MSEDWNPEAKKRPIVRQALNVFIALAIINFAAFWIMSFILGGDALSGRAQGDHYYLNMHGKLTEVSQAVYVYSRWHALSAMLGMALCFCAIAWMAPYRRWFGSRNNIIP
jgi:hypothetical protein